MEDYSWASTLESLVPSMSEDRNARALPFGPRGAPKPRKFDTAPVVMVMHSESNTPFAEALLTGLHLLYEVTEGFKVVVFTSTAGGASSVTKYPCAVEHCMVEDDWDMLSNENWVEMAQRRFQWARKRWGARFTFAPESYDEAREALEYLGRMLRVPIALRRESKLRTQEMEASRNNRTHEGLRGRVRTDWESSGAEAHLVFDVGGVKVSATHKRSDIENDSLALVWGDEADYLPLVGELEDRGWSIVRLRGAMSTLSPKQCRRAVGGLAEGIEGGPKVLIGPDSLLSNEPSEIFDATASTAGARPAGYFRVKTSFGRALEVSLEECLVVFDVVSKVASGRNTSVGTAKEMRIV